MRGDTRGFVHKRIGRAVVGGVTGFIGGGPGGAIGGAVGGFVGGGAPERTGCPPGFDVTATGGCAPRSVKVPGLAGRIQRFLPGGRTGFTTPFGGVVGAPAPVPVTPVPGFEGAVQRFIPGGATGFETVQTTVMPQAAAVAGPAQVGQFGAGIEPMVRVSQVRDCPRGMILGVDSLCYNRRDLRNSERFWPRGRRPLLTGGEMRAISTAASAARKLQRKQKDLMKLGLLPKPAARRRAAPAVTGHRATLEHN